MCCWLIFFFFVPFFFFFFFFQMTGCSDEEILDVLKHQAVYFIQVSSTSLANKVISFNSVSPRALSCVNTDFGDVDVR